MILITCGTNEQPFDRLVAAAHDLGDGEHLFVQHGASQVEHGFGEWVDFVSFDELADRMRDARVVISHAGVGSIILARRCGKVPIIVPRRADLGEAVDDHQVPLARRLHDRGLVELVENVADLPRAVRLANGTARLGTADDLPGADALAADLREGLDAAMRRRPPTKVQRDVRRDVRRLFGFREAAFRAADPGLLAPADGAQVPVTPIWSAPASGGDERVPQSMSPAG
jgi:UDP-N-acetylglucosamine transferase subunit ALG13